MGVYTRGCREHGALSWGPHVVILNAVQSIWGPLGMAKHYLEGQGDLVSGLIMGIIRVTIWVIGAIKPLTKSP